MKVNRQKENAFMIQKLSRNRLERRDTQSTLLLGAARYMQHRKYTFVHVTCLQKEAWQLSL